MKIMKCGLLLVIPLFSADVLAWTQGDMSGNIDIGGIINPAGSSNPWEVLLGPGVSALEFSVNKYASDASIVLQQNYPVLGIRTRMGKNETFKGTVMGGISPQISYTGLVTTEDYKRGILPFSLPVLRPDGSEIGLLRFHLLAVAEVSRLVSAPEQNSGLRFSVFATQPGEAFYGGIARNSSEAISYPMTLMSARFPEYVEKYNRQGMIASPLHRTVKFDNPDMTYSGFYGAGLLKGSVATLNLKEGYSLMESEKWSAKMSVTVAYI